MKRTVKEAHSSAEKQDHFKHGHHDVDQIKYLRGLLQLGNKLAHNGTGHLGAEYVYRSVAHRRNDRHDKDKHTHSSDPMRKAAPEKKSVTHALNIREHRRARRCKSAYRFEKRIGVGADLAAQDKRNRADRGKRKPRERNNDEAFLCVDKPIAGL